MRWWFKRPQQVEWGEFQYVEGRENWVVIRGTFHSWIFNDKGYVNAMVIDQGGRPHCKSHGELTFVAYRISKPRKEVPKMEQPGQSRKTISERVRILLRDWRLYRTARKIARSY